MTPRSKACDPQQRKAAARPKRSANKPRAVADDARHLLAWQYRGKDLLSKLALITDRDNTLYRLLWAYGLDGPFVLSEAQREFLAGAIDPDSKGRPWGRLVELMAHACNDPEVQADEQVYGLADLFARLAILCELAGTSAVVGRAIDLAQAQRGAAVATRLSGDRTRGDVADAWADCERRGVPIRARVKTIVAESREIDGPKGHKESTVRDALRALGLYDPKRKKRG